MTQTQGRTRIAWQKIETPDEARPQKAAYELERVEGYWEMTPVDNTHTRLVYVLDTYPGGIRVPESMIRWANNSAIQLPAVIEHRHRVLQMGATQRP